MIALKAKTNILVFVWAAAAGLSAATPYETFERWCSGPLSTVSIIVDPGDMTVSSVREIYSEVYPAPLENGEFRQLSVFVNSDDAFRELRGKGALDYGYPWWRQLYERYGRHPFPKAEVTAFGGSSVLRIRSADGTVKRVVLAGHDFFTIVRGAGTYQILEICASILPLDKRPKPHDWGTLNFYIQTSTIPSKQEAEALTRELIHISGETRISTMFQADTFFADSGQFPIIYRFGPAAPPPPEREFGIPKSSGCTSDESGVYCSSRM
jgi:hypothetical protein